MKSLRQIAEEGTYDPQDVSSAVTSPTIERQLMTDRARDSLQALVGGKSSRSIGVSLLISIGTLKSHINSLMQQTGCNDRAQVVTGT